MTTVYGSFDPPLGQSKVSGVIVFTPKIEIDTEGGYVPRAPRGVKLLDGEFSTNVVPGPYWIETRIVGSKDWAKKRSVVVPDQESIEIDDLLDGGTSWDPMVVGAAQAARDAAIAAKNAAQGILEEVEAGVVPDSAVASKITDSASATRAALDARVLEVGNAQYAGKSVETDVAAKYTKPSGGIPLADIKKADLDATYAPSAISPRTTGKRAVAQDEIVFNAADYVAASGGTALTEDAQPAIIAAFNAMKQSGKASGRLLIPDNSVIASTVDLDGGFTITTNPDNWSAVTNQRFVVEARGLKVNSGVGVGLKLHGFYGLVTELSFRGGGSSSDVALEVYNLQSPDISVDAYAFAGTVLKGDVYSSGAFQPTRRIRGGTVRKLNVSGCGQAIYWRGVEAFGSFDMIVDNNNVNGSYFGFCADTAIKHYENFSPTSQTVGLTFEGCNNFNGGVITMGDRPSEALIKIVGNTADPAGVTQSSDFGSINRFRTTGLRSEYPAENALSGVKLVDVKSINIDNVLTARCYKGVEAVGSNLAIKQLHSVSQDTTSLSISGDSFNAAPLVDVGIWARTTDKAPVKIGSSVTGGVVKLHGHFESTISQVAAKAGQPAIDSASTGVLDIAGLTSDATGFGSITNHPGSIRGTISARFAAGSPSKGTIWVADGAGAMTQVAPGSNGQVLGYGSAGTVAPVTPSAGSSTPGLVVDTAQTSITNTTTEGRLTGYTIPAGSVIAGRTFRIRAAGTCAQGVNTGSVTWRLRLGGESGNSIAAAIVTAQSASAQTRNFALEYDVTFRAASGESIQVAVTARYFAPGASGCSTTVSTVNTTTDRDLVISAVWATADAANIISVEQGTVEQVK